MANFYGELVIRITSDTAGLKKGLTESAAGVTALGEKAKKSSSLTAQRLEHVGRQMQNVGRQMTQFITLPIAAGFAIAGVAAFKFEDSLMKIQNLTGTNAAQTKAWGDELLKLGAATGQTPLNLAESLYFVASSGFRGAEAMEVITVSAKAAAAGLGDVMVTADVLTSAMNSYGHGTYTAAEVTDYLMKTIEVGKAEPTALATSLGRIMPIANQLKVGLDELGGNVAALTLGGLSSAEAVTALRGTMVALVSPAKMSIDELKTLGLTYQEVTASIADKGLLPTLKMLWEATDHNMLSMRKIIPNVRATTGVMSLLGANYKENLKVIDKVSNAHGALDRAMKNTAQQPVQKLRQAWASLQASFIKIGAVLLPIFARIGAALARMAERFAQMSPGWRNFLLGAAAAAAVIGPLVMITGTFVNSLGLLLPLLAKIGPLLGSFAAGQAGMSVTAAGLTGTGMMGGIASLEAMAAGLAAAVPVVAIAGAIATAVTLAIDAGMKKAAENAAENAKTGDSWGWSDFVSETKAMFTAPGKWFSEVTGNTEWMATSDVFTEASKALDSFAKSGGMASQKARYLREDLSKLRANRDILGDLRVEKSVEQMQKWRMAIMENLKVSKRESEAILRTMFGPDIAFSQKQWKAMNSGIEGAQKKVRDLKAELARATAFGDLPLITSLNKQLDAAEARVTRIQTKAKRQAFARQANTMQIPGIRDWVGGGAGAIKIPVPQWAGKMKFPKVDVGGAKVALQGMGKYLGQVTKTRKLTITAKINTVQDALKGMRTRLKEIGDKPTTAKLKAEKQMLEAGVKGAKALLRGLKEQKTNPKVTVDTSTVAGSVDYVNRMMASIQDKYVKVVIDAQKPGETAWGKLVTRPEVRLVGEDGPEVILPLNKPARMLSLMRQAGIAHLAAPQPTQRLASVQAAQPAQQSRPVEIHYHSHVAVPQGIVVDDTEKFARRLAPWQERELATAARRRKRGVPNL